MNTRLEKLIEKRKALSEKIKQESMRTFPDGSRVYFTKWNKPCSGIVLNNFGERLRIRSDTGKEYTIDLFWLLRKLW